jgi:1,4-dihydroxy-2-naphthoyl-CoA hydrolase
MGQISFTRILFKFDGSILNRIVKSTFFLLHMKIWKHDVTPEQINNFSQNTMVSYLGIEFTEIGNDYLKAKMPVDARTHQPMGLLHGGASVTLAETLGSSAGGLCVNLPDEYVVGIEINANHVKSVRSGYVYGTARPVHLGRKTQVWEIKITNDKDELVCISRLTLAVISNKADQ